jgi:hypothetical protein
MMGTREDARLNDRADARPPQGHYRGEALAPAGAAFVYRPFGRRKVLV